MMFQTLLSSEAEILVAFQGKTISTLEIEKTAEK